MSVLAEQVALLRERFPLADFDKEQPDEPEQEKKLRGYLYVALARIEELEQANTRPRVVRPAPEPISTFEGMQGNPALVTDDEDIQPGAPIPSYRSRGWRQVEEPAPFNKYRRDRNDNQNDTAEA